MHKFMSLKRDMPAGIFHRIVNNTGQNLLHPAPFRLQAKVTTCVNQLCIFFGPFKIGIIKNNHFQLAGFNENFRFGRTFPFGRKTYPVESAAERM